MSNDNEEETIKKAYAADNYKVDEEKVASLSSDQLAATATATTRVLNDNESVSNIDATSMATAAAAITVPAEIVVAATEANADGRHKYHFSTNENGFKRTFPEKLMEILDHPNSQDILQWMPDGEAFCVLSPTRCTDEILPKFFKQTKFPSFVRKLNRWGFKQISKGTRDLIYRHPLFKRNRVDLCQSMRCMASSTKASYDAFNLSASALGNGMPDGSFRYPGYPPNLQQVLIPSNVPGHPPHLTYLMHQFPYGQIPGMIPPHAPSTGGKSDVKESDTNTDNGTDEKTGTGSIQSSITNLTQLYPYSYPPYYPTIPGAQQQVGGLIPVPYFFPSQPPIATDKAQEQVTQSNTETNTSEAFENPAPSIAADEKSAVEDGNSKADSTSCTTRVDESVKEIESKQVIESI